MLEHCEKEGIGFIPWFPIATGDLARPDGPLARIAGELGATPAQLAIAWLLRRSPVTLPIPGTSSVAHLEENVAAAGLRLTDEQFEALSRAVPPREESPPDRKKEQLTPLAQAIRILSGRRSG